MRGRAARAVRRAAAVGAALLALVAAGGCSPVGDGGADGRTTVTFRLWDDQVAAAYRTSFAQFEKRHPSVRVRVQLVPWSDYFTKLTADVGGGDPPDVFWTNTSNFGVYADNGHLLDVGTLLRSQVAGWQKSVTDLYTRHGTVWGVPQLWDSIALYYNKDLVEKAGVDPAKLRWSPSGRGDTLLPAARRLTSGSGRRRVYGFNASNDPQGVYWNFVGSNGGVWQRGDAFADANPRTAQAMQYLVDMIHRERVAPPAADTTTDGQKTRELFTQGRLALFESGTYNLKQVQQGARFRWGVAPLPEGPAGRVGVVHGVAAVAAARTPHRAATLKVLRWLGSAAGQRPIADGGYAFPGVTAARSGFTAYWRRHGTDVTPFEKAAQGRVFPAPLGPRVQAGATAMEPVLQQMFLGRTPVAAALRRAQSVGNAARTQG